MASAQKILVSCLILACFVSMAMAVDPKSEDVSYHVKRQYRPYRSHYARDCKPDVEKPVDWYNNMMRNTFYDCFIYGGHKYYLSHGYYKDVSETQFTCMKAGGYIVQINTKSELEAIRNYVRNVSSPVEYRAILIDGTDKWEEGTWTLFDVRPLPVLDWYPKSPDGGDCLCLDVVDEQKMFDVWCDVPEALQGSRYPYGFMCEIPA